MKCYFIFILSLSISFVFAQTEIPLEIDDGGYIFLKVKINDKDTARFMLDTGGGVTCFSSVLLGKYNLQKAGFHTGTRHNGEVITGTLYKLTSLSIGDFTKQNIIIGSFDALHNCDGLLSMDYFRDIPFTIDFRSKRLIIETAETIAAISRKADKLPIQVQTNGKYEIGFFVTICVNDSISMKAEFDTGAGFNMLMLQTKYLSKLNINLKDQKKQDYGYYVYSTSLPLLTYCGSVKLRQENIFVGFKEGLIYDALIGSGMFRDHKLTINIPGSEILAR